MSRMEEKRATVEEYKRQLKEKHGNDYTGFQYKLWAEMVAVDLIMTLMNLQQLQCSTKPDQNLCMEKIQ